MKHAFIHNTDIETTRRAAQKAWETYRERFSKYAPSMQWEDDTHARLSFSVKGIQLKGEVALKPRTIDISMDVPFVFLVFKKRAIKVVEAEIQKWIDAVS